MAVSDPIADFLTRIRNGIHAQHDTVAMPSSKLKVELSRILKQEGYIQGYDVEPPTAERPGAQLVVRLRYADDRSSVISGLRRVSRPGRRVYVHSAGIPKVQGGMGTTLVSTSRGVMTGHDARRQNVGGEVLAKVW